MRGVTAIHRIGTFSLVEIQVAGHTNNREGVDLVWAEEWRTLIQTMVEEALGQDDHRQ
jgi:hypothetical protein